MMLASNLVNQFRLKPRFNKFDLHLKQREREREKLNTQRTAENKTI